MPIVGTGGAIPHAQLGMQLTQQGLQTQQVALQFAEATKRLELAEKQFAAEKDQFNQNFQLAQQKWTLESQISAQELKMRDLQIAQLTQKAEEEKAVRGKAGEFAVGGARLGMAFLGGKPDEIQAASDQYAQLLASMGKSPFLPELLDISGKAVTAVGGGPNVMSQLIASHKPMQQQLIDAVGAGKYGDQVRKTVQEASGISTENLAKRRQQTVGDQQRKMSNAMTGITNTLRAMGLAKEASELNTWLSTADMSQGLAGVSRTLQTAMANTAAERAEPIRQAITEVTRIQTDYENEITKLDVEAELTAAIDRYVTSETAQLSLGIMGGGMTEMGATMQAQATGQHLAKQVARVKDFLHKALAPQAGGAVSPVSKYKTAATDTAKEAAREEIATWAKEAGLEGEDIMLVLDTLDNLRGVPSSPVPVPVAATPSQPTGQFKQPPSGFGLRR